MSTPPVIPNVEDIAAPIILGTLWNWTLYGVLVVQVYVYSYNFTRDKALLKLLVYSIFLAETLQTALSGADLYYWFVSGFGNMDHLTDPYLSAFDVPMIGSIVSLAVQIFFVYRIWVLSGRTSWVLCSIICLFSTVSTVAAFGGGVYTHAHKKFARGRVLKILALTWLGGNTLSDSLIAGSMVFYLGRRREGYDHSIDHALSKIVRLTIETNTLTATVEIVSFLMVAIFPDKNWFTCPTALFGKLYSNALLVSLNNRISIRERRETVVRSLTTVTFARPFASQPASEIVHVELEKPSVALVAGSSQDSAGQQARHRNRITV